MIAIGNWFGRQKIPKEKVTINEAVSATSASLKTSIADTETKVAETITRQGRKKAKLLKVELETKKREEKETEQRAEQLRRKLLVIKRSKVSLEEKYKLLMLKKRNELVDQYRKVITKLKKHPIVDSFSVDSQKRIIIATKLIKIKKPRWRKEKEAGIYQIRVDFSQEDYGKGIQILNTTKRYKDQYDSPMIMKTEVCWGNIAPDIKNDFKTNDLYELIIDIIDYLTSPNDEDGYLKWSKSKGEYKGSWEEFFDKAQKMPESFNFDKYDQNNKSKNIGGIEIHDGITNYAHLILSSNGDNLIVQRTSYASTSYASVASVSETISTSDSLTSFSLNNMAESIEENGRSSTSSTTTFPFSDDQNRRQPRPELSQRAIIIRELIKRGLMEIGFTDQGAYHFAILLTPEGGLLPYSVNLGRDSSRFGYLLTVETRDLRSLLPTTAEINSIPTATPTTHRIERLFVNRQDLRPNFQISGNFLSFQFDFNPRLIDEMVRERAEGQAQDPHEEMAARAARIARSGNGSNNQNSSAGGGGGGGTINWHRTSSG